MKQKCKNGLEEPAHNGLVCTKDVISGRRRTFVCVCVFACVLGQNSVSSHILWTYTSILGHKSHGWFKGYYS